MSMSKYIFTAKKVLDDGTEETYFFDKENKIAELESNGFCFLSFEHSGDPEKPPKSFLTVMEDINIAMLAAAIHSDKHLNFSAKLASMLDALHPGKGKEDK